MTGLIINTSTSVARVVLFHDKQVVAERTWPANTALGPKLLSEISELLKEGQYELHSIDRIAVHRGPGNHSGLRLGVVTATLLAKLTGADLVEMSIGGTIDEALVATPVVAVTPHYTYSV